MKKLLRIINALVVLSNPTIDGSVMIRSLKRFCVLRASVVRWFSALFSTTEAPRNIEEALRNNLKLGRYHAHSRPSFGTRASSQDFRIPGLSLSIAKYSWTSFAYRSRRSATLRLESSGI
jgi:hypothetical protein